MLRACVLEFGGQWDQFLPLAEFAYNNSYNSSIQMAPFEALYGRRCRTPVGWFESTEPRPRGTDLIQEALDQVRVIQDRLRIAQSRHQSYANRRRRPLRFSVGDRVFLRVSPMKGVMRFGRWGKLSPRYIGPFEILRTVGEVAYELALPPAFSAIHPVFHVSMLRRYIPDESHVLQYDAIELDDHLTFVEEPVAILARDVRKLRLEPFLLLRSVGGIVQSRRIPRRPSRRCESGFPACLSLQVLLDPYFRGRKFFLVVDIVITLIVIFSVLSSVHRLERFYSYSKSFITCWD